MSEHDSDLLERFFDGELPAEKAAEVARQLEADEALAAELTELSTLRTMLREHITEGVQAANFDGFFDGISAALAEAPAPRAEAAPSPARAPAASESTWDKLRAWWGRNWTPVVVSAAAAAAVALIVVRAGGPGAESMDGVETDAPVVVEAVSNDGNQTVLISSPADEAGGATVIWLLEEEQVDQDDPDASLTGEDPI